MEENNNQNSSNTTEDLKNQTVNTAKQVKETMKNVNIKEETMVTKNTMVAMFKDPIGTVEGVAEDKDNKFFKTSLFLIIVWAAIALIKILISGIQFINDFDEDLGYLFKNFIFKMSTLGAILVPVLVVITYAAITFILDKNKRKSIPELISVVTVSYLPVIVGKIISILNLFSDDAYKITGPINSILSVVTTVLLYFGLKASVKEDDDKKFIITFVIIIAIYQVVALLFNLLLKIYM